MLSKGDLYPVWWQTFKTDHKGNLAVIKEIRPYKGRYTELFTHDLVLEAPNTRKGYLEMSVNLNEGTSND